MPRRGGGRHSLETKSLEDVKYRRQIEEKRIEIVKSTFSSVHQRKYLQSQGPLCIFFVTHQEPVFLIFITASTRTYLKSLASSRHLIFVHF